MSPAPTFKMYGVAVVDEQRWFFAAPFSLDGTLLVQQAVVVRIPLPHRHYVDSFAYSSLKRRYFVLDVRRREAPPEIGWGDPLVQRLMIDLAQGRVMTPPMRSPGYIDPVAWSPSERYLLYRVDRNVPAWQVDAEGASVERAEKTLRLLDLQTNRELPLPKAIAQVGVAGFFAEQPDTVWALHGVALERNGLNATFSLKPARAPKPPTLPSARWVYRILSRRLERMSAAQHRALQENWNYLRWQLGGEGIGALGGSDIYARTLTRLRDQLLAQRIVSPQIERTSATVLQVGQRAVLLEVEVMDASTLLSKTPRFQYHYYLVERARPNQPRRIGATIARHEAALMEDAGRVWVVVADRSSGRISILNGQGGYFRQTGAADALLRLRGVEAHWQRSELERQIRAWLQEQGIEIQAFGAYQLEGLSF